MYDAYGLLLIESTLIKVEISLDEGFLISWDLWTTFTSGWSYLFNTSTLLKLHSILTIVPESRAIQTMAHLHDIDKIKPGDKRVQSRFVEDGGHKWRMCTPTCSSLATDIVPPGQPHSQSN